MAGGNGRSSTAHASVVTQNQNQAAIATALQLRQAQLRQLQLQQMQVQQMQQMQQMQRAKQQQMQQVQAGFYGNMQDMQICAQMQQRQIQLAQLQQRQLLQQHQQKLVQQQQLQTQRLLQQKQQLLALNKAAIAGAPSLSQGSSAAPPAQKKILLDKRPLHGDVKPLKKGKGMSRILIVRNVGDILHLCKAFGEFGSVKVTVCYSSQGTCAIVQYASIQEAVTASCLLKEQFSTYVFEFAEDPLVVLQPYAPCHGTNSSSESSSVATSAGVSGESTPGLEASFFPASASSSVESSPRSSLSQERAEGEPEVEEGEESELEEDEPEFEAPIEKVDEATRAAEAEAALIAEAKLAEARAEAKALAEHRARSLSRRKSLEQLKEQRASGLGFWRRTRSSGLRGLTDNTAPKDRYAKGPDGTKGFAPRKSLSYAHVAVGAGQGYAERLRWAKLKASKPVDLPKPSPTKTEKANKSTSPARSPSQPRRSFLQVPVFRTCRSWPLKAAEVKPKDIAPVLGGISLD